MKSLVRKKKILENLNINIYEIKKFSGGYFLLEIESNKKNFELDITIGSYETLKILEEFIQFAILNGCKEGLKEAIKVLKI